MHPQSSETGSDPVGDDLVALQTELIELGRVMLRLKLQIAHQGGLHQSAVPILGRLRRFGPMRQASLASSCGLDPSTVSRQVDALVRAGLVRRVADPDDGRATRLELTDLGQDELSGHHDRIAALLRDVLQDWDREDIRELAAGLHRFVADATGALQRHSDP